MRFSRTRAVLGGAVIIAVASGGTGYAAGLVTGADVKNESLTGADIKNRSLAGGDVANGSLTGADIRNKSVSGSVLVGGTVTGAAVKNGSLTAADLATGALTPRVTARFVDKVSSASNDFLKSTCRPGEVATGGSAQLTEGSIAGLSYFDPGGSPVLDDAGVPVGWTASWYSQNHPTSTFRVTAMCLAPPS